VETIDKASPDANHNTLSNKDWLRVLQIIGLIGSRRSSHFSSIARSSRILPMKSPYAKGLVNGLVSRPY